MKRLALTTFLSVVLLSGHAWAAHTTGVWNINQMNQVTLTQEGTTITGTYAGQSGNSQLTGTLVGDTFKGWFFENKQTLTKCGPGNTWDGVILLKFSADGRSVTGDEGDCRYSHDPDGSFDLSATSNYRSGTLLSGSPILFGQVDPGPVSGGPVPMIWANEEPEELRITENDLLSIVIRLDQGNQAGINADWWLVVIDEFTQDVYHFRLDGAWPEGLNTSYQGPIFSLSAFEVLNGTLSPGSYYFYFGVDTVTNGQVDFDRLFVAAVHVTVQ